MMKRTKSQVRDDVLNEMKGKDLGYLKDMHLRYGDADDTTVCELLDEVIRHIHQDMRMYELLKHMAEHHEQERKKR